MLACYGYVSRESELLILNITRNKLFVKRFWHGHGAWTVNVIADMVLAAKHISNHYQ
jgi:hypothetical protein